MIIPGVGEVAECTDGDCERKDHIMIPCCIGPPDGHIKDYTFYHLIKTDIGQ